VAADTLPVDTTGLPAGATFGASTGLGLGFGADTTVSPDGDPQMATTGGATADATTTGGQSGTANATTLAGVHTPHQGPLTVGQAFGPRYQILRVLGVGGMGAVYQAWDAELGVPVALKVIRGAHRKVSPELEKRFKNELLLARQVTHKSVVRIHDLGEIEGIKYITMPYIQGDDLATVLRREGRQTVAATLEIARDVAHGLRAAHEAGVVHRDLKPANVMVKSGAEKHAVIMDFGISTSADNGAEGGVVGTLEYMAPEQAAGGNVDARSDIYAFGLILYELLTGQRPRGGTTPQARVEAMQRRFAAGLPPLRRVDPSIPEPVEALVMRCVERDPADRFQSTAEICSALGRIDPSGELIREPTKITRPMLALGLVLVLLLLGGTYFATRSLFKPPLEHAPVSVLITDFDNRTGDADFTGAVEQTLTSALETASFVTVYPRRSASQVAAKLASGPSRIDEVMGRLISKSEGIGVMVTGAIERQGNGYAVSIRALDPADEKKVVAEARATAGDKSRVLPTVGTLATGIRRALGDRTSTAARETFTAASLDAMRAFARAQELQQSNRYEEALAEYQRAVQLDPGFARAYSGMAGVYINYFRQPEKAAASYEAAMKHLDRMTDREKYRTLGAYYVDIVRNYEKAIENFETLVRLYPADDSGHGNLALAYLHVGDVPRALAEVRKSLDIYPRNSLQRYNYAMYAMYAGDFATAIGEARQLREENSQFEYALLPAALSRLAQGDAAGARESYAQLAAMSPLGASFARMGEADMAMYHGQYRAAIAPLAAAIAVDVKEKNATQAAQKKVALAEAYAALGQPARAAAAATEAARLNQHESTLFPAARVLVAIGKDDAALQLATELEKVLQRHTTAYAGIIRGEIALRHGRLAEGIEILRGAQQRHDSWFSRFVLGKAYVEAEHYAEALTELELCLKRRGETTDVFFYDIPTIRYQPPLYYWLARAQEALGAAAQAQKNYEQFLALRVSANPPDPLALDAQKRLSK
jgi:serine/threonine protein kinase/tetratricopeptide (TPR) repeat protein